MIKHLPELEAHLISSIRNATDYCVLHLDSMSSSTVAAVLCCKAVGAKRVTGVRFQQPTNNIALRIAVSLGVSTVTVDTGPLEDVLAETVGAKQPRGYHITTVARQAVLGGLAQRHGNARCSLVSTLCRTDLRNELLRNLACADIFPLGDLTTEEVLELLAHYEATGVVPAITNKDLYYSPESIEDRRAIIKETLRTGGTIVPARGFCDY